MRKFDDILKNMNVEFHEKKLKQYGITITDEDIDNYAYNFGFDSDEYTREEKRLLTMNRVCYWLCR